MESLIHTHNKRAKRLSLRVDHKAGAIRLTIPPRISQWSIDRFVTKNQAWIQEKSQLLSPKIVIEGGTVIPFQGIDHQIIIESHTSRSTEIFLSSSLHGLSMQSIPLSHHHGMDYPNKSGNDVIFIRTSRTDPTSNLKQWTVKKAREIIEPMAQDLAETINKPISRIDLRDTATRWGSCSTDKRLMLCWRLIMAPSYVLQYVVAHEVAHLKHMDHSQKFWDLCYQLSDRPDEARAWLKQNGNSLMRYF